MSHIGSYESRLPNFNWAISEEELGYKPGDTINIGWYCSDRICEMGKAQKKALIWEIIRARPGATRSTICACTATRLRNSC